MLFGSTAPAQLHNFAQHDAGDAIATVVSMLICREVVCETPPLTSLTAMVQIRLMCPARTSHDHPYTVNKDRL